MNKTSKKSSKREQNRRYLLLLLLGVILVAAVAVTVLLINKNQTAPKQPETTAPTAPVLIAPEGVNVPKTPVEPDKETLISGFTDKEAAFVGTTADCWSFDRFGAYEGVFIEQGYEQEKSLPATLALVVTNRSAQLIDYAEITLSTEKGEALFVLTGIPAGQTVLVQESTGLQYDSSLTYDKPDSSVYAPSGQTRTLAEESVQIFAMDGVINLHNKTNTDLENVMLYYKAATDGIFLGGILYRINAGTIAAGQTAQCIDEHYLYNGNELLYVTIGHE